MILRTQLTPIFDEYDIDVVLQGHDHTYSRTKLLYGDGQTHGTYEFRLNEDGSDYDWDNAYNTQTDEQIPLYPEDGSRSGQARRIPSPTTSATPSRTSRATPSPTRRASCT